jgi:hypothetical protein
MDAGLYISPFVSPLAVGLPLIGRKKVLVTEGCRDAPKRINFELIDGPPDALQIVNYLAEFAKEYGKNECVLEFARCLQSEVQGNNDREGWFSKIADFCLEEVLYVSDPLAAEYVRSPVQLLKEWEAMGKARGDCDDHVLLANSLFSALGIPNKAVAVQTPGAGRYNHVICAVNIRGKWSDFDPCFKDDPFHIWTGPRIVSP